MLEDRYDVVIVGSGPAGAAAAKAISGQGLKSVIIEKASQPRYKLCSGILFPSSLEFVSQNFGPIPKSVLSEPARVRGNRIALTVDTPIIDASYDLFDDSAGLSKDGLSVKRAEFDHWLCLESGVPIVDDCGFAQLQSEGDDLVVEVNRGEEEIEIRTRYLIGADGTRSPVRHALSPGFDKSVRSIPNYEEWYTGQIDLDPEWLYLFFDRSVTGYFATVFHKEGKIIVVTGTRQGAEPVRECFKNFVAHLEERHGLVIEERVEQTGCGVHDMSATNNYCLGEGNVLLAGEAGGFNRCGEGITSALVSGQAAGESILRAVDSGGPAFATYPDAVAAEIEACTAVNRAIEAATGLNPFTRD